MSTVVTTDSRVDLDDPILCAADTAAVLEQFVSGKPLDPVVAARVHGRAARVTESVRLTRGCVDDETFQSLLDEDT